MAIEDYNKEELQEIVAGMSKGKTYEEVIAYIVPNKKALAIENLHYMLCNRSHAPGGDSCTFYAEQKDEAYRWSLEKHKEWYALYTSIFGDTTPQEVNEILNAFGQILMPHMTDDNYPIFLSLIRAKFAD